MLTPTGPFATATLEYERLDTQMQALTEREEAIVTV